MPAKWELSGRLPLCPGGDSLTGAKLARSGEDRKRAERPKPALRQSAALIGVLSPTGNPYENLKGLPLRPLANHRDYQAHQSGNRNETVHFGCHARTHQEGGFYVAGLCPSESIHLSVLTVVPRANRGNMRTSH